MVDAIVSALLEQLTAILRQEVEEKVKLVAGVDEEINSLFSNLQAIQDVLKDAEKRQVREHAVRGWLEKLKLISYDMEDVLGIWTTSIDKVKALDRNSQLPKKKLGSSIPFFSKRFKQINHLAHRHEIANEIKQIKKRMDDIAKEKSFFNFEIRRGAGESELDRPRTTSLVDISEVYGREAEKNDLVSKLLSGSSEEGGGPQIIAVQGFGGIGKTTLAKLAYNDKEVERHFAKRIWVCVSTQYDLTRVAREILAAFHTTILDSGPLEILLQEIRRYAAAERFLLVLDDVWTEKSEDWEDLWLSLKSGPLGSRILLTTRKEEVAKMLKATHRLYVKTLPEAQCWLLFRQHAFLGRTDDECQKLEELGQKIANKCKGLPLAAKTLGGFMRDKASDLQQWEEVLKSKIWKLEDTGEIGLFAPLLLSYYDLPSPVQRCFSYLSIFPKDRMISRDRLIKLWMAQGYLNSRYNKEMELVGQEYFQKLATRSFFQDFEKDRFGSIAFFKIHDIVHDFARFLTRNECLIIEADDIIENQIDICINRARHAAFNEISQLPASIFRAKKVRTLLVDSSNYLNVAPLEILQHPKCLRAFEFSSIDYSFNILEGHVPRGVKDLIHLRYLNLCGCSNLKELPDSLCELHNLQTLDIAHCHRLKKLPHQIGKLINLRHLHVSKWGLMCLPKGIRNLNSLRTLTCFKIDRDKNLESCSLEDLKYLTCLGGSLCIAGLGNIEDKEELDKAQLENKRNLLELELWFSNNGRDEATITASLQPPKTLRSLKLIEYQGTYLLRSWMASLNELHLEWNNLCESLPELGILPSLERLHLQEISKVKKVGGEFLGTITGYSTGNGSTAFPKLKQLTFTSMKLWEEWDEESEHIKIMPCLTSLNIYICKRLKSLPSFLLKTPLQDLRIEDCPKLAEEKNKFSHIQGFSFT